MALKEWAVVVEALGRGEQVLLLRKGGLAEGRGGFRLEHRRFLLYPTLFHQQRESLVPEFQRRFDELVPRLPPAERVRVEFVAEVVATARLTAPDQALALRGQHDLRDEVITHRFDWGHEHFLLALVLRVARLAQGVELPALPAYGGCKSWVELAEDVAADEAVPVADESAFQSRLAAIRGLIPNLEEAST
jgi:hypothetical protein